MTIDPGEPANMRVLLVFEWTKADPQSLCLHKTQNAKAKAKYKSKCVFQHKLMKRNYRYGNHKHKRARSQPQSQHKNDVYIEAKKRAKVVVKKTHIQTKKRARSDKQQPSKNSNQITTNRRRDSRNVSTSNPTKKKQITSVKLQITCAKKHKQTQRKSWHQWVQRPKLSEQKNHQLNGANTTKNKNQTAKHKLGKSANSNLCQAKNREQKNRYPGLRVCIQ